MVKDEAIQPFMTIVSAERSRPVTFPLAPLTGLPKPDNSRFYPLKSKALIYCLGRWLLFRIRNGQLMSNGWWFYVKYGLALAENASR